MRTLAYWLALLLVFQVPFEKLITLGERDAPTFSRYFGFLVAGVWLLALVVTDRFRKPRLFHVLVYLFLVWNAASLFWSISISHSIIRLSTYAQLAGLVIIVWDLFTTPASVRAALQAYVLGAWVSAGSTILNFIQGVTAHDKGNIVRYAATGFNENEISLVMALGLPMAWHLATFAGTGRGRRLLRLLNYAYVPAGLFSIVLTASRGGLVCAAPACLYILLTFKQLRLFPRLALFAVLVGVLFALQGVAPEASYERLSTTGEVLEGGELNGRGVVWRLGFQQFLAHPLTGVGTGTFQVATELGRAAHNAYLSVLVELGAVGFGLFLAIIVLSLQHAMRLPRWEARLWVTVLIIWMIGVMPLSLEHRKPTWLVLSLPVAAAQAQVLGAAVRAAVRRPAAQPAAAVGQGAD